MTATHTTFVKPDVFVLQFVMSAHFIHILSPLSISVYPLNFIKYYGFLFQWLSPGL